VLLAALCACILLGCSSGPEREREIGEAFVGPSTLKLRKDMDLRSAVAGSVSHGERLSIIRRRRRFVKVRTAKGAEGWTDMLLIHLLGGGRRACRRRAPRQRTRR
jgi:hypothetical protein